MEPKFLVEWLEGGTWITDSFINIENATELMHRLMEDENKQIPLVTIKRIYM